MLAQSTLRLVPPEGFGQAARVLRGRVDPDLSPDAKPPPIVDEVPVRELADVTRGLPLSGATAEQVQALADSDRTPFALGQAVRTLLDGEGAPKGLTLEATRRATRWAKKKRADAPRTPRPAVGVAADLRKSPAGSWDDDNARSWEDAPPVLGPPPTRNRTTHPFVGTIEFHGLPTIRVETPKGGTRSGTDADGVAWSVTMPAHYGEFARTEGADGDPVDVFVGPNRHAPKVYVVHLQDPATGAHDEDKVFVGFDTADAARACFAAAYNRNDLQMGAMRTLTTSELAEWLGELDNRGAKIDAGRDLHKADADHVGSDMLRKGKHFKDEDTAKKAHARVVEQYGLTEKDGERYWRLKTHIYEQMGGSFEKSDLPAPETAGTPAENRKPAAAAPPPAPPPVARPHHHAESMQLPTKPTKRFPPPSHPKPTRAPRKLMETPLEMTKAQQRAMVDELLKAAGHKYIRRTPKAGGGFRYFYAESAAARGPSQGESVRLGEHVAHIGEVTPTHVTVDGEKLTHGEWLDRLSDHYAHFERDAAARAGLYARAVLRHVPPGALDQRNAAAVHAHIAPALARTGMTADAAQRAVEWALNRKGWSPDASAALLGEMTIGQRAKWVQENYQRVGAVAEDKRGNDKSKPVRAVHIAQAVDALAPKATTATRPHAELLAEALGAEFPGLRMEDLVHAIRTVQAHEKAAKAPPKSDGAVTSVYLPGDGGRPEKLAARFKLVEASELVASHDATTFAPRKDYPQGLQERAYHRDKAEQAKVMRNAAGLIPEYVANTNPDAVNGTPLVDERGVVLGGNSRTMSMQRAYREGAGAKLKAHLADNAAQFGLARKDVEAMEHPVLVRVVDTAARDPKLLVRQMNESMTQEMDPRVMQVAMGRKLDDDAVGKLAESMGTDQTLSEFLDSPASESFITALRRVGIIDARNQTRYMRDGKLNADGKQLVERVIVGKVVGDPDLLSDTNPSVVTALAQAIPYMVQAEAHGEGFNIRNDLREALAAHNDMQRRGLAPKSSKDATHSVREYTRQDTMFGGGDAALSHTANTLATNERAQVLASVLFAKAGPRQLAGVFRAYAEGARHNPEGQFSMFGPAKTPAAILSESVDMTKSIISAQRHEADALLKAAGVEPKKPAPKKAGGSVAKATKDVGKVHERMQKIHTKAADEAANRGDGELSMLHADAAKAHEHAAIAHAAGDLDGKATKNAKGLSDAAKAATQATLDKHGAVATSSAAAKEGAATPKEKGAPKPAAPAHASGVGGRSKEGLKVIAIGPKGGKIVGYTTKDGKQKPIYEGSKAAAKLAATVEQHAPDPAPAAEAPADGAKPAADAAPATAAQPDAKPQADAAPEPGTDGTPASGEAAPDGDVPPDGATPPADPPDGPSEPIDDKPLSPESQAGGEPADAPAPEDLGSASPKTDSPESRHAEDIAKMKGQVEEAHRKLEALAAHIDKNLVPMFNNLKSQARATHRSPNPSAVGWLIAQIGRFVSFVMGLNEDRSKTLSATDAIKGEADDTPGNSQAERNARSDGANGQPLRDGASDAEKKAHAEGKAYAKKNAKPAKRPRMKSGKQASDYMQKSLTAPGAENACVRVLVTLQAIERHHHAAHIQAEGPESYQDHLLFGRLYEGVQDEIDGLSEKMVAAFGKACVDADARAADAASLLAEWGESDDTLDRALDAELQLQGTIEDALAEDVSPGLENFLQGLADSHEAAIYLLQQRIQPPDLVRSMQRSAADELLKAARALG